MPHPAEHPNCSCTPPAETAWTTPAQAMADAPLLTQHGDGGTRTWEIDSIRPEHLRAAIAALGASAEEVQAYLSARTQGGPNA